MDFLPLLEGEIIMLTEKGGCHVPSDQLSIFTLGRFEIYQSEKGSYTAFARTTKLWDLFKYLLVHKGKGIAPEIILENLYPDEVYENPKNTLQNIVYRLRKLLKEEEFFNNFDFGVLFSNGCYSLYLPDNIFIDSEKFESYVKNAESCIDTEDAINNYERAIELYCGDYFPELLYEDWIIPKRNYYRRMYIQALLHLFELYKQREEYRKSVEIFEKAIQIEPYEEELHICFIESLIGTGKMKEAKKHYEYITGILYKQFGIKPTVEMQKIYQLLKRKQLANESIEQYLENDNPCGAFYCEPNIFRSILLLEKRRSERTGDQLFPVSVSIEGNNPKNAIVSFRETLINSLRKGDVVTDWNESKLLILLPKIEYKHVMMVMDRIIKKHKANTGNSNIEFKIKVHSVPPMGLK